MAYLHREPEEEQQGQPQGGGLLANYAAQQAGPFGAGGGVQADTTPGSGPTATGHINFDSIYAANSGTAARMANQLGGQVQGDVQGAKKGLQDMQQQYGQAVKKGVSAGPSGYDYQRAAGNTPASVDAYAPANLGNGQQTAPTGSTAATTPKGDETDQQWLQRIQAGAGGKYTGPQNLQQMKGYGGLLDQYTKAGGELGAVGSNAGIQGMQDKQNAGPAIEGGSRLDAALTGQAGRPAFASLQQKNNGFSSQLGNAVTASQAQSQAAQANQAQNDNAYKYLLGEYAPPVAAGAQQQQPGADPNAQWDGFDPATQSYGNTRAGQNNGQAQYHFGGASTTDQGANTGYTDNGWGFSAAPNGSAGSTEGINVGQTGGNTDWNGWFGGADTGNKSPEDLGLTPQEIWSLSLLPPDQRAAWLKKHNGG